MAGDRADRTRALLTKVVPDPSAPFRPGSQLGYAKDSMPRGGRGAMPSKRALPRVLAFGAGLEPNPAETLQGASHRVKPLRPVGNFSDRKTPHKIFDTWTRAVKKGDAADQ